MAKSDCHIFVSQQTKIRSKNKSTIVKAKTMRHYTFFQIHFRKVGELQTNTQNQTPSSFFFLFFFSSSSSSSSSLSPWYQHILALCVCFLVCLFLNRGDTWLTISSNICVWCLCVLILIFVSILILWILKNFAVSLLLCRISKRWIDVCFQPWCNPLWLTGLKAPTN